MQLLTPPRPFRTAAIAQRTNVSAGPVVDRHAMHSLTAIGSQPGTIVPPADIRGRIPVHTKRAILTGSSGWLHWPSHDGYLPQLNSPRRRPGVFHYPSSPAHHRRAVVAAAWAH